MKRWFKYRYADEKSHKKWILSAVIVTGIWLLITVSQYHSYMVRDKLNVWFEERLGIGIFVLIYWGIVIFLILHNEDRQYMKHIFQNGEKHDGKIVAYVPHIKYISHGKKKPKRIKTYMLCVKCGDDTIITPELKGNPERVLKSDKCSVYYIDGVKKYVTDFDTRFFRIGKGTSIKMITERNFDEFFVGLKEQQ